MGVQCNRTIRGWMPVGARWARARCKGNETVGGHKATVHEEMRDTHTRAHMHKREGGGDTIYRTHSGGQALLGHTIITDLKKLSTGI